MRERGGKGGEAKGTPAKILFINVCVQNLRLNSHWFICILTSILCQRPVNTSGKSCKPIQPKEDPPPLVFLAFPRLLQPASINSLSPKTERLPSRLLQMRNISSNNGAHCNVQFVLSQLQSFSTIYLCAYNCTVCPLLLSYSRVSFSNMLFYGFCC